MTRFLLGCALSSVLLGPTALAGDASWTLDPAHSEVGFKVRHLAVSNVRGEFNSFSAEILADEQTGQLRMVEARAQVASIDTGVERRDADLRGAKFFDADKYPELKLKTRSITWKGSRFTAVADLTMRNVTKTVTAEGELLGTSVVDFGNGKQRRVGYVATATVNRKDFGLSWNAVTEGVAVVGDEVEIRLEAEAYLPIDPKQAQR